MGNEEMQRIIGTIKSNAVKGMLWCSPQPNTEICTTQIMFKTSDSPTALTRNPVSLPNCRHESRDRSNSAPLGSRRR